MMNTNNTEKELTGFPSIDKPWLKYYSEEAINASLPECTIYEYLWENNKDHLDDVALIYFGRKIKYNELFKKIDIVASAFSSFGIKKGDIVTIQSLSIPQVIYCIYALSKIGAVANLVYANSTSAEIIELLVQTKSKLYLCMDIIFKKFTTHIETEYLKNIVLMSISDEMPFIVKSIYDFKNKTMVSENGNLLSWKKFVSLPIRETSINGDNNDTVVMVYTGGTTGKTKAVMLSNYNLNLAALQYVQLGFERGKTFLSVIPPFIAFGITVSMHMPLANGLKTVLHISADPSEISKSFVKYKPNYIICGTVQAEKLANKLNDAKIDLSHLICFSVGGDILTNKLENQLNSFLHSHNTKICVAQGYAMSETSAATAASTYTCFKIVLKRGTIGVPLLYTNVKIVDENTNKELQYNTRGEICINSPCNMSGYYKNEEETNIVIKRHDDGLLWVHTGDIGSIDEDGFITIVGRIKRIVIVVVNGIYHKVFPKILEDKFMEMDCINAISIVGRKTDSEEMNELIGFVVLNNGYLPEDVRKELSLFSTQSFEEYERPRRFVFIEKIPITTIGKVNYRALEKMAEQEDK